MYVSKSDLNALVKWSYDFPLTLNRIRVAIWVIGASEEALWFPEDSTTAYQTLLRY